jgi:large subunit ribosomal protein L30
MTSTKLYVKQVRSLIGVTEAHRKVARGLGLRGIGTDVTVDNTPSFRGMIKKIHHLVAFEEISAASEKKGS